MAKVTKKELEAAFDTIIKFMDEHDVIGTPEKIRLTLCKNVCMVFAEDEPKEQA